MGEPARKLEPEDRPSARRLRPELRLIISRSEMDEADAWVLRAIMTCYCTGGESD